MSNIIEKLESAQRSLTLAQTDHVVLLIQAFKSQGEEHNITDIEFGFSDVTFSNNGDVTLRFEDCVVHSDFGEEDLDELVIQIKNGKVIACW